MERSDQKYRPVIVRPRGEDGGEYWFVDGKIRGLVRIVMTAQQLAEVSQRTGRDMNTPRETREMENVPARLKHMDELGIDVQVLYPTIFIEQITDKPEWEIAICRGYNRWRAQRWRNSSFANKTGPAACSCAASKGIGSSPILTSIPSTKR
jgi:hypothetical protein